MPRRQRTRIFVRGGGILRLREREPSNASLYSNAGYLSSTKFNDEHSIVELIDERGDFIDAKSAAQKFTSESVLKQSGIDEIEFINLAANKLFAMQYYGLMGGNLFQYFCSQLVRVKPSAVMEFKSATERTLSLLMWSPKESNLAYDVPLYFLIESDKKLHIDNCVFWISPRNGYGYGMTKVLDISGYANHGTISGHSVIGDIWKAAALPLNYLSFDGANDQVSFGNVNNITNEDAMLECWLNVREANGNVIELSSKKASSVDADAGWRWKRGSSNEVSFNLSDGTHAVSIVSADSAVEQNDWHHVAIALDRSGNGQIYIDGAASGAPVSISSVTTLTNAANLYLARLATDYSQIYHTEFRMHKYGVGGLPLNIAAIIADHYNAEKDYHIAP
jgi:hypothetical protein